ncbi:MBOAT family protein, partial [bacterium c-19]|nr:MBOAT family protein [bacterium c-19]
MLFSSLTFLFSFLPCLLLLYFIVPRRFIKLKNMILLVFSLCFYAWGEPKYIILMLGTVLISYLFGLAIHTYGEKGQKQKQRFAFVLSVIAVLSSLVYFKYMNFLLANVSFVLPFDFKTTNIILPIGISFYTFQILSYLIDLYRGKLKVQKNFFHLALYISFFPQLIAGPIVQYETIEDQLMNRKESFDKVINGLERFIIGLGKKVIIANQTAVIADAIYNSQTLNNYSSLVYIVGMLAYTFQIYFDFSGYSDMAIGLGKIFGFEFLENFNYPYIANSVTEFWRRWHISLTTFFREYLYIPLGGNRVSKGKWVRNMLVVWLLTGLWHGAAWNFILWGLYYFILLYLEKTILKEPLKKLPNAVKYILTFI